MANKIKTFLYRVFNASPVETQQTFITQPGGEGSYNILFSDKRLSRDDEFATALLHALAISSKSKQELWDLYLSIEKFHLTETIVDAILDDVFFLARKDDEKLFKFTSDNPSTVKILTSWYEKYKVEDVLYEAFPTLLVLDEYLVRVDTKEQELDDDFDQQGWRAVYRRKVLDAIYLSPDDYKNKSNQSPEYLVPIYLRKTPRRIKLSSLTRKRSDLQDYHYYVYEGRGTFDDAVIALIKAIRLLELLIPVSEITRVKRGQNIYLRMPAITNINDAFKLAGHYERMLNGSSISSITLDDISSILEQVSKYRVVPVLGDKGAAEYRDQPSTEETDTTKIDYLKKALANKIPIPTTYLGLEPDKEILLRYLRFLRFIRKRLALAIKQMMDIIARASKVQLSDYKIVPVSVPGSEDFNKLDYLDTINMVLDNLSNALSSATSLLTTPGINKENLVEVINTKLAPISDKPLLEVPKEEETTGEF